MIITMEGYIPLENLILIIGKAGYHVFVRYDPAREKDSFTIVIGDSRLCDTDEPVKELLRWWEARKGRFKKITI